MRRHSQPPCNPLLSQLLSIQLAGCRRLYNRFAKPCPLNRMDIMSTKPPIPQEPIRDPRLRLLFSFIPLFLPSSFSLSKSCRMNTYTRFCLQTLWNEHLRISGGGRGYLFSPLATHHSPLTRDFAAAHRNDSLADSQAGRIAFGGNACC